LGLRYQLFEGPLPDVRVAITTGLVFYAAFVMSLRYANLYRSESRIRIAIETFGMLVFITSALSLGTLATMVLVACITTMFSADISYGLNQARCCPRPMTSPGTTTCASSAIMADRLFAQATRYNRPAGMLMIDSDHLKQINDRHGHEAGGPRDVYGHAAGPPPGLALCALSLCSW